MRRRRRSSCCIRRRHHLANRQARAHPAQNDRYPVVSIDPFFVAGPQRSLASVHNADVKSPFYGRVAAIRRVNANSYFVLSWRFQ
jgi:hypothetical protein